MEQFDEYGKALIFALKKWISDEIFAVTESGVYRGEVLRQAAGNTFTLQFVYYTDETAPVSHRGGMLDDNVNVSGSVDIWLRFKGYDSAASTDSAAAVPELDRCIAESVRQLGSDGILKERFGRDIPIAVTAG